MKGLRRYGLDQLVHDFVATGKPLLGICLGMQMLATSSEEFGLHPGLNLIPGRVLPIPATTAGGEPHKIPHIGWNGLLLSPARNSWNHSILQGLRQGEDVYLVHSFTVHPDDDSHRLADCHYNGRTVSAAIRRDNVHGTQFHPEKSQKVGLAFLDRFVRL
jgi:glutamine amidotransferase